ncbi:hypothetical protein JQX13_25740 [Archangium violaceum]|uniref:hypothetical protein n=1 Tax=Archangium violaceum TaxID=83451 RepID=UPI00193B3730|nr:hypothetical protein [Archangium violaceum]QRK13128.1 hypothetical protein JQX13_25740 [Archangium violaceum]
MDRKAIVANTRAADEHVNVNRLRVPEFSVLELGVEFGGKSSKTHVLDSAQEPKDKGSDDFNFAPEKEKGVIVYEIDDQCAIVDAARLELYTRFDDKPLWQLELAKLGADWLAGGQHKVTWDGRIVAPTAEQAGTKNGGVFEHDLTAFAPDTSKDAFPDGYVTLEHTPFKLKLVLESKQRKDEPAVAWTYFHILVKKIELELGPEECVVAAAVGDPKHLLDKAVRQKIEDDGGLPQPSGALRKVFLPSNLFKMTDTEMDDNTAFGQYQTQWGDGPNIPILAKIRLADSQGAEVKLEDGPGAVALGKVKFLWDWEDPDEDVNGRQALKPRDFLGKAIDYYKDGTDATRSANDHEYPKGDNCHVDRGGKRGPGAKAMFPKQDGYDAKATLDAGVFPFKVEPCKQRKWAAYSQGWCKGKLIGQTGVLFQPSRMAGDDYVVSVYLAYDKTAKDTWALDVKTEPLKVNAAITARTGTLQLWRELHLARYVRKDATVADFVGANLANMRAGFHKAYVEVEDKRGADNTYLLAEHRQAGAGAAVDYNAVADAALVGTGNVLYKNPERLAVDPAADHAADASAFNLRSYEDFVWLMHERLNGGSAVVAGDLTAPQCLILGTANLAGLAPGPFRTRVRRTQNWLRANGVDTRAKYSDLLTNTAPFEALVNDLHPLSGGKVGAAPDGVSVVHFDYVHSVVREALPDGIAILQGVAMGANDRTRNRCVLAFFQADFGTLLHEIGHHVFLPHSKHHVGNTINPAGAQDDRHDDDDDRCIMSYSNARDVFCGLCQLRLRGWDATALRKDDDDNRKP